MIDLSSNVTAPAKPGLLPFALDMGGGSDAAPDAMPSFALTLTDLMAVAAPAGAPVADGAKPVAGRQKAAVTGAFLPELAVPVAVDARGEVALPALPQDDAQPEPAMVAAPADTTDSDPQLEPALAWLMPPVVSPTPPPLPGVALKLAVAVRGKPVEADAGTEAKVGSDSPAELATPLLPGSAKLKTTANADLAKADPAQAGPVMAVAPSVPVPITALSVPTIMPVTAQTVATATLVTTPAPTRQVRTATVRATALAGVAAPVVTVPPAAPEAAQPVSRPNLRTVVDTPVVPAAVLPVASREGPVATAASAVGGAPVAVATPRPSPALAAPVAASVGQTATPSVSSDVAEIAVPTPTGAAPVAIAPQLVAPAAPPARQERPVAVAAPRVQATPTAPVTIHAAAAAPAAASVAVEAAAPRRADGPVVVVPLATPATSAQPIAVAAAGGAQQAGIDLTRDPGLHRMIDRIETLRDAADARDTRIRLIPDSLGPVEVSVRRSGDAVQVHFTAAEATTRQLITDAQPRLAELAEARGVRIENATVDGSQPANNQAAGSQSGSQSGGFQPGNTQSGGANTGQPRPHTPAQPQHTANSAAAPASDAADESTDDRIA